MFRNIFTYHTHTHTHHRGCIKRINRLRINVDRNEIQEGGAYVKRLQYCISPPWNKDKLHLVYDFARECVVSARSNSIWNKKKKKTFVLQWICTYNLHAAPRYQVEEETKNTRFICCTCAKGIFMYDTFTLISLFHSILHYNL